MVLNGEEGLKCEVQVACLGIFGVCFGRISYGTDGAECSRKVVSGRRVSVAIRALVNDRDLQLQCAKVLHKT